MCGSTKNNQKYPKKKTKYQNSRSPNGPYLNGLALLGGLRRGTSVELEDQLFARAPDVGRDPVAVPSSVLAESPHVAHLPTLEHSGVQAPLEGVAPVIGQLREERGLLLILGIAHPLQHRALKSRAHDDVSRVGGKGLDELDGVLDVEVVQGSLDVAARCSYPPIGTFFILQVYEYP